MINMIKTTQQRIRARVRSKVNGTSIRPRLSVMISNRHVTAQIIDDSKSQTLVYASTVGLKASGTMTDKAKTVGAQVADLAKKKKITTVVFDRGDRIYRSRLNALASAARDGGLDF